MLVSADVALEFKGTEAYLQNTLYDTIPLIVHGNGRSKLILNSLGNYLASAWNHEVGCLSCWDDTIDLPKDKMETWPTILIALFVDRPTPFVEEFLEKIYLQSYPKSKLHLFIYNNVPYHEKVILTDFVAKYASEYKSVKQILPNDGIEVATARSLAMYDPLHNYRYYFLFLFLSFLSFQLSQGLLFAEKMFGIFLGRLGITFGQ